MNALVCVPRSGTHTGAHLDHRCVLEPMLQKTKAMSEVEQKELIRWVTYMAPWELFATLTSKHPRGLFETARHYERFMDRNFPQVSHFYAVEPNPSGDGGHHVHSAWAGTSDLYRRSAWKKAYAQVGVSRIEPIRNDVQVKDYCLKYVTKAGALWWFRINQTDLYHRIKR